MTIAAQQHTEIVERRHNTGQFYAIDQKNRQGDLLFAYGVQKKVLKILRSFSHCFYSFNRSAACSRYVKAVNPLYLFVFMHFSTSKTVKHFCWKCRYSLSHFRTQNRLRRLRGML
jgi:hypothetical protein